MSSTLQKTPRRDANTRIVPLERNSPLAQASGWKNLEQKVGSLWFRLGANRSTDGRLNTLEGNLPSPD